jgi:glycosyltransferase involved in cell wall biosynthesis
VLEEPVISIVIPLYNEEESLSILHEEIAEVAREAQLEVEVIFVDDGSTDRSWEVIAGLAAKDHRVQGIRFRGNFGKAAALSAGVRAAHGEYLVTLDADLQDDPREIPRFLETLARGVDLSQRTRPTGQLDLVSGWKRIRHDPWHKVGPSRIFNRMVSLLTGVHLHDHNCGMKAYRAQVLREVHLYGERHRFIPVLAAARGFRVGEMEINHRPRRYGQSKYGVSRFIKGFLDLLTVKFLTGFGQRPQHVLGSVGLFSFVVGIAGMCYLAMDWVGVNWLGLWQSDPLHKRPLLIYSVAGLLLGAQLMSLGLLAELITSYSVCDEDRYSIAERTARPGSEASESLASSQLGDGPSPEFPEQRSTTNPS